MPDQRTRLNVTETGSGPRTVILGNGLGTNQRTWRYVVGAMDGEARFVGFDFAGTPDSDLRSWDPRRYETLQGHADDVIEMLDQLDVQDALWVGHSVSAMIGALAALAEPTRITSMLFVGASPHYLTDGDYPGGMTRDMVDGLLTAATDDYLAWTTSFSPLAIGRPDLPQAVEEFSSYLRRMRSDIGNQTLRTIFGADFRPLIGRIEQPVLVGQTSDDVVVPDAVGSWLAARLPHGRLAKMSAVGHIPQLTAPEQVVALIREALAMR